MLTGHATVLVVEDLRRAVEYYRDRLGFTVEVFDEEQYGYATTNRDNSFVHFAQADAGPGRPNHEAIAPDMFDAYFWPDDVDALHAELTERGAMIIQGPTDQPYGLREFRVQDPDGYVLAFGKR